MNYPVDLRRGWCPGALRPMQSGDGLLLRVRPHAGAFSIPALFAIADAATRFGSGEIDVTSRANLQLRGVTTETYPEALAALDAAGLIDVGGAEAEAIRNVVVDPLSGIDPGRIDVRALAAQLEKVLARDRLLWGLPGKFGFSFSGTLRPRVGGRSADVMVAVARGGGLAIFLDDDVAVGAQVPDCAVVRAMTRIAEIFLELRSEDAGIARMRNAVDKYGSAEIFNEAGLVSPAICMAVTEARKVPVGILAHADSVFAAGVGLPFGRIRAAELATLCAKAAGFGIKFAHPSPERVLVFVTSDAQGAMAFLGEAENLGLITTSCDRRLAMDVCPGRPACRNATTETRRDAQHLADALQDTLTSIPSLHISGCEKGCARRGPATVTLVARNGRYDVICNDGPGGHVTASDLAPADIDKAVARLTRKQPL